MKREIFGALLLLLLISLALFNSFYLNRSFSQVTEAIDGCEAAALSGSSALALRRWNQAFALLNRQPGYLRIVLRQPELDSIYADFYSLYEAVLSRDIPALLSRCEALRYELKSLAGAERLSFGSLF